MSRKLNGLSVLILGGLLGCGSVPSLGGEGSLQSGGPEFAICDGSDVEDAPPAFEASPGGVPEVSAEWVAAHHCRIRLVDVREPEEVAVRRIEGVESLPLGELAEAAAEWDPREPVVLICRSGRRSARAAQMAESMGMLRVASMTGGMLAWGLHGLPTVGDGGAAVPARRAWPLRRSGRASAEEVEAVLRASRVREVRAAALLLGGSEACVDGREEAAVLGTPGGDAGELLLALSTIEALADHELSEADVGRLFEAYVDGFGRFYMHTDDHALEHLGAELAADARFSGVDVEVEMLLRRPPRELRDALLEHLVRPANVGCGHLKLVSLHPGQYGVRRELTRSLLEVVFRKLWRQPEAVEFVVLHGEHQEEAVLNIRLPQAVYPFSNVPAIAPRIGEHSFFVNHPQVANFVRAQHAHFLFDHTPVLADAGLSSEDFEQALRQRANAQLEATLQHLARTLPIFDVVYEDGRLQVNAR